MKIKNNSFIALVLIASLIILLAVPVNALYNEPIYVLSEDVSVTNSSTIIDIPVKLSDNKGIMGFALFVSYDKEKITPIQVSKGEILVNGMLNDSIDTNQTNTFKIVWTGSDVIFDNGNILTMQFKLLNTDFEQTKVEISYSKPDTFDGEYKDIVLDCEGLTITNTDRYVSETSFSVEESTGIEAIESTVSSENETTIPNSTKEESTSIDLEPSNTTVTEILPTNIPTDSSNEVTSTTLHPTSESVPSTISSPTNPVATDPYELDSKPVTDKPTEPVVTETVTGKQTEEITYAPTDSLGENPSKPTITDPTEATSENPSKPVVIDPTEATSEKPINPIKQTNSQLTKEKKANPIKVSVKKKTIKLKKIIKKAQKVKVLSVKKAKGRVTYKLVKKGITKRIREQVKISKKGAIIIKRWKNAKKGNYKIKIKITANGNKYYNKKTVSKTVKLRIK